MKLAERVKPGQAVRVRVEKKGYLTADETIVVSEEKPQQFLLGRDVTISQERPHTTDKKGTQATPRDQKTAQPPPSGFTAHFTDASDELSVSVGGGGITVVVERDDLAKGRRNVAVIGNSTVYMYLDSGRLYADVTVATAPDKPVLQVKHNALITSPYQWDFNYNDRALEVVNPEGIPYFQMIFVTEHHIVINGIFPNGGYNTAFLADDEGVWPNRSISQYTQKPIFQYPAWRYPGVYAATP